MITSHTGRRLLGLLYLAGALLLVDQLADLAATLLAKPLAASQPGWRFGAFGLLMTRISVFLIGDVILFTAALGLAHRKVLRGLGFIQLLLALGVLAGLGMFTLDWVQVRTQVAPGGSGGLDLAGLRAAGIAALGCTLLGWAGVTTLRATRLSKSARRSGKDAPLLTGTGRDEAAP
jgi:hypothetical protein